MSVISLASLLVQETKDAIFSRALSFCASVGLPTTAWQVGGPELSILRFLSETLEMVEALASNYVRSGFLDYASGDWLILLAQQVYGVEAIGATYGSCTCTLTNSGGGIYQVDAGDLIAINSGTGATYRNADAATINGGAHVLTFVADVAGSAGNASVGQIDTLQTTLLGVTITNTTASVGVDAESELSLRQRCRDKLGMLSPNGPKAAYDYVVRTPSLTGSSEITRSRTVADSTTGQVTVYVAGASGSVSSPAITAAQTAVETYCTPLCITPTVVVATPVTVAVAYAIWVYTSVGLTDTEIKSQIASALGDMIARRPIGGDVIPPSTTGYVYNGHLESTIRNVFPNQIFRLDLSTPASDTALTAAQVAVLGSVTGTVHFVEDP